MRIPLILALITSISGCSGNSSSSKSSLPAGSTPINQSIAIIDDILVNQRAYDENGDNWLTPTEQSELNAAVAAAQPFSQAAGGSNNSVDQAQITKLVVRGNAETSNQQVQLHTNQNNGLFSIIMMVDNSRNDADIRLMFSNQNSSQQTQPASTSIQFDDLPEGEVIIATYCNYQDELSFRCGPYYYFLNGEPYSSQLLMKESDNGENFPAGSGLPLTGYVIATHCQNDVCFENGAEVSASFN